MRTGWKEYSRKERRVYVRQVDQSSSLGGGGFPVDEPTQPDYPTNPNYSSNHVRSFSFCEKKDQQIWAGLDYPPSNSAIKEKFLDAMASISTYPGQ